MSRLTIFLLGLGIIFPITQSFANDQQPHSSQRRNCEEFTTTSPVDAYDNKVECLLNLKRFLTEAEIAFLIDDYYEPEELYKRKLISLKQKQRLEANRL